MKKIFLILAALILTGTAFAKDPELKLKHYENGFYDGYAYSHKIVKVSDSEARLITTFMKTYVEPMGINPITSLPPKYNWLYTQAMAEQKLREKELYFVICSDEEKGKNGYMVLARYVKGEFELWPYFITEEAVKKMEEEQKKKNK